jgi:hypothetical protein
MSDFIVEIVDTETNIVEIETSYIDNINNIEIERYEIYNVDIINTERILLSDLPDSYPMNKIIGNLSVYRISGLSDYLDSYEFDCGTP